MINEEREEQNKQNKEEKESEKNKKSKKDPHGGVRNTQARGRDKIQMTLGWIGRFHFSVCSFFYTFHKQFQTLKLQSFFTHHPIEDELHGFFLLP